MRASEHAQRSFFSTGAQSLLKASIAETREPFHRSFSPPHPSHNLLFLSRARCLFPRAATLSPDGISALYFFLFKTKIWEQRLSEPPGSLSPCALFIGSPSATSLASFDSETALVTLETCVCEVTFYIFDAVLPLTLEYFT